MPRLFSYGTLQRDDVQITTFGRVLAGRRDALVGFALRETPITDPARAAALGQSHYVNAVESRRMEDRVEGMVFDVTDAELAAVDEYESLDGYERIRVSLASGRDAWLYVAREVTQGASARSKPMLRTKSKKPSGKGARSSSMRDIEVPADFARALKRSKRAAERWNASSFSHRREHVEAIEGAKRPETRARRIERAIEMLEKR